MKPVINIQILFLFQASEASKATAKSTTKTKAAIRNLYCSACNKLFKNIKSFENHENSKKHKENVASMTMEDDIDISENDNVHEPIVAPVDNLHDESKVNGQTDQEHEENLTSDIEDNDIRETLSDDSDKVKVCNHSL